MRAKPEKRIERQSGKPRGNTVERQGRQVEVAGLRMLGL